MTPVEICGGQSLKQELARGIKFHKRGNGSPVVLMAFIGLPV